MHEIDNIHSEKEEVFNNIAKFDPSTNVRSDEEQKYHAALLHK